MLVNAKCIEIHQLDRLRRIARVGNLISDQGPADEISLNPCCSRPAQCHVDRAKTPGIKTCRRHDHTVRLRRSFGQRVATVAWAETAPWLSA